MQPTCFMNGLDSIDSLYPCEPIGRREQNNNLFSRLPDLAELIGNAFKRNLGNQSEKSPLSKRDQYLKTLQQLEQSLNDRINQIVMRMAKNIGKSER